MKLSVAQLWSSLAADKMMPMPGTMPQTMPQQMMWMLPQAAVPQAATPDYASIPGYRPGMEMNLTTSSIPLFKLPKVRLTECLEFVVPELDVMLTATLNPKLLRMIVWEATNVKPNMNIRDFRVSAYLDLYKRLRGAMERVKKQDKFDQSYPQKFQEAPSLEEFVMEHAVANGFNPAWLEMDKKSSKSSKNDAKQTKQQLTKL